MPDANSWASNSWGKYIGQIISYHNLSKMAKNKELLLIHRVHEHKLINWRCSMLITQLIGIGIDNT